MEGKASCSCGQDSLNVIHILKMVSLLKKFNSKKHKAKELGVDLISEKEFLEKIN